MSQSGLYETFEDYGNDCRSKVGYPSRKVASGHLRVLQRDSPRGVMNAYRCKACGRWHVGHVPFHLRHGES